jgi:hypothetical protein
MDDQPSHDPAAQLVAWHNRHPLALRITRDEVSGVGVVVLPFVAIGGAVSSRWARLPALAWRRLRQLAKRPGPPAGGPTLTAAFSEDFIAPISPRRAADFALCHGSFERIGDAEWPQREVAAGPDVAPETVVRLFLSTASVERGRQRARFLISNSGAPKVIGPRLWHKRRVVIAGGVLALAMVLPLVGWFVFSGSGGTPDVVSAAPAASAPEPHAAASSASAAVPAASAAASVPVLAEASASAAAPAASEAALEAPQHADAASSAITSRAASAATERGAHAPGTAVNNHLPARAPDPDPVPTELAQDEIAIPAKRALRPVLSASQRAEAIRQAKALRETTPPPPVPAPAASRVKVFALVTSLTGTRSASERRQRMMALSFAGGKMSGDLRSEIMQVDKGWRATLWPFDSKAAAEAARDMLEERGVYTEVVSF